MSDATPTPPGARVLAHGRYELEEPIASGGVATVWRAFDARLERSVAIKLLHPHLASDAITVQRFERESLNGSILQHPNVVAIYDFEMEGDVAYLVMEYVDGPSLKEVLASTGPMDPTVAAALGEQVASALGAAHRQGLIHRDVKPANILIASDGSAKVTDFGIAKALAGHQDSLTETGSVVGTAAYVAPEQMLEDAEVDARADVYALGVVLFECLTGQAAFAGDTPTATAAARLTREVPPPRQVRADVPRALDEIIVRATRRDPRVRYTSGDQLAAALRPLVENRPADVTATLSRSDIARSTAAVADVSAVREPRPMTGRRRIAAIAVGLAGLVLIGVLSSGALRENQIDLSDLENDQLSSINSSSYDPPNGDGSENEGSVRLLTDNNLATSWSTEPYQRSPRFGNLKAGVGVWFEFEDVSDVAAVILDVESLGFEGEVRVADEVPDDSIGLIGWDFVTSFTADEEQLAIQVDRSTKYVLVWLTLLVPESQDADTR
ncbi:MAG TPA: protein kinase, partial [Nitriliruptorales bacterium]